MLQQLRMMNKKALSSSKKTKNNPIRIANIEKLQPYLGRKKNKKPSQNKKLNDKENHQIKFSLNLDQFPLHSIRFKNSQCTEKKKTKEINQGAGEINQFVANSSSCKKTQPKQQIKQKQAKPKQKKIQNIKKSNNLFQAFCQAVDKIFQGLDIFNRGKISEANINKWIPQSALYFLGIVFQKMRQERLCVNQEQFKSLCQPIYIHSSEEDIKWFIEEVSGKEIEFNVSINQTTEEDGNTESQVETKISLNNKNLPTKDDVFMNQKILGTIVSIKDKQLKIIQKKNEISNEIKSIFPMNQNIQTKPTKRLTEKQKQIKTQTKLFENPISIIKQENQQSFEENIYQRPSFQFQKLEKIKYNKSSIEHSVPNFTFQLPNFNVIQYSEPQSTEKSFSIYTPKQSNQPILNQITNQEITRFAPVTARIMNQRYNLNKSRELSSESKRSVSLRQEADKIDKLSSRLQEYIKMNIKKIETSKSFIKECGMIR